MIRYIMTYRIFDFTRNFRFIRGFKDISFVTMWLLSFVWLRNILRQRLVWCFNCLWNKGLRFNWRHHFSLSVYYHLDPKLYDTNPIHLLPDWLVSLWIIITRIQVHTIHVQVVYILVTNFRKFVILLIIS